MALWRWGVALLVVAIGLAVSVRRWRGYAPPDGERLADGFAAFAPFADARHDLV
ncbi:MAG: hypothetical protein IT299_06245 [Dehalococcoidia bacterium]|nr:hypothetical protein [Dehalococcoidia bacterium]